jgi:hypothetical protein
MTSNHRLKMHQLPTPYSLHPSKSDSDLTCKSKRQNTKKEFKTFDQPIFSKSALKTIHTNLQSHSPTGLLCFLLNRRLALTTFSTCTSSAKLGAKIGRSMLPAQSRSAASSVCRVTSKKDMRCASEPFALRTSTRRVRCRSFGAWSLARNGLSGKMRRRKRGMVCRLCFFFVYTAWDRRVSEM